MRPSLATLPQTSRTTLVQHYIKCSHKHFRYFENEDGTAYIPIGINICFPRFAKTPQDGLSTMIRWLDKLAENGGNYSRLFLGHPFFDIEPRKMGDFDETQAKLLDTVIDYAWSRGIRLKLTLELFRTIGESAQAEIFPGAINFGRPTYHSSNGGMFSSMDEFLQSNAGKRYFLSKLEWLSRRYRNHPCIFGWELWNEMNAVSGEGWDKWTEEMLPRLKKFFPKHLTMQSLGSFDRDSCVPSYRAIMPMMNNEVAQVHRYLDLAAPWLICHGPIDVMMSDAVATLRRFAVKKPVLLSEGGAVEGNHTRPWDHYPDDKEGSVLHDVLFSAFFAGAAGCGNAWHWLEYVDRNNLWWHFKRFASSIAGIDPIKEQFVPCRSDTQHLRVYVLNGKNTCLAWCRDASSNWETEFASGIQPATLEGESIELPIFTDSMTSKYSVTFYDPWTNCESSLPMSVSGIIELPPFQRSIIVRISCHPALEHFKK